MAKHERERNRPNGGKEWNGPMNANNIDLDGLLNLINNIDIDQLYNVISGLGLSSEKNEEERAEEGKNDEENSENGHSTDNRKELLSIFKGISNLDKGELLDRIIALYVVNKILKK